VTALGSSRSFQANVTLNVGQAYPAKLLSPPPGAIVTGSSATFNWDAGVGTTQYRLLVGSTLGGSDVYSGQPTSAQSATVTVPVSAHTLFVTLSSYCGGVWQQQPPYPFPVGPTFTGTPPNTGPALATYTIPNNGNLTAPLPFCLASPNANPPVCDGADYQTLAQSVQSCSIVTIGSFINVAGTTANVTNPYDQNYAAAFDVAISASPTTTPGTYDLWCNIGPYAVVWLIQITQAAPQIKYVQQYPPNPDGSFYVTLWGQNFGSSSAGQIEVCPSGANPCSGGGLAACLSPGCGNAYFTWSDGQINILVGPGSDQQPQPGLYDILVTLGAELVAAGIMGFEVAQEPTAAIFQIQDQTATDISNDTQTVVVGQQIALQGGTNLSGAFTQVWSVSGGSYVGGYSVQCQPNNDCDEPQTSQSCLVDQDAVSPANPNGCIPPGMPLIMSSQNLTIYFTQAPATVTVTYAVYGVGINPSEAMATTTFNVVGPSGTGLSVYALQSTAIVPGPPPKMQLGSGGPGIGFQGTANPPAGYSGTLEFIQVVSLATINRTYSSGTAQTCVGGGLDTMVPYYGSNNSPAFTGDTPGITLASSTYIAESDYNTFVMFLMWWPNYANSIAVPLGFVNWGWGGSAVLESGTWVLTGVAAATDSVTQPTTTYPLWSQLNPNPPVCVPPQ
jgi:hypothetical protein